MPTEMVIALTFARAVALILVILFRAVRRGPPGRD